MNNHDEQSRSKSATPSKTALLVEYQKAQDSAEHHDTLVWTITGFVWAGDMALLGFILSDINKVFGIRKLLIGILSLILNIAVLIIARQFRSYKILKYERCKYIERELNLWQHKITDDKKYNVLRYQNLLYTGIMCIVIFGFSIVIVW